jgi:pseudouridine synthase
MPPPTPTAHITVAYHKPRGLLTTHADELGRETVYDRLRTILPPKLARLRWQAIGRLDADTTGLLILTTDGGLVHHGTQPSSKVPKTYEVLAKGLLGDEVLERLRAGVELSGGLGRSGPCEVSRSGYRVATTDLVIRLTEGKNRQIRRMLLAVGSQVIRLHRAAIGTIALDVPEDGWRLLSPAEIADGLGYRPAPVKARCRR